MNKAQTAPARLARAPGPRPPRHALRQALRLVRGGYGPRLFGMTQRWAYVGALGVNGALDWGGTHHGNTPGGGRLEDLDSAAFWKIVELANQHEFEGRQVDWGAWALKVNGAQLRKVLQMVYGDEALLAPRAPVDSYLALADELGDSQFVALIAAEL